MSRLKLLGCKVGFERQNHCGQFILGWGYNLRHICKELVPGLAARIRPMSTSQGQLSYALRLRETKGSPRGDIIAVVPSRRPLNVLREGREFISTAVNTRAEDPEA